MIHLHCQYEKQGQLIFLLESHETILDYLQKYNLQMECSKDESHRLNIIIQWLKLDKDDLMNNILDPIGLVELLES